MEHGNVVEFLNANPRANRLELVMILSTDLHINPNLSIFFQLSDVADGLFYLHGIGLVHGDLKGVCTYSISDNETRTN
jgi:serine/threonine protein kinase